ncbi:pentapeptide repeat-containing protein, partial [Streptomyces anthocyanicus]
MNFYAADFEWAKFESTRFNGDATFTSAEFHLTGNFRVCQFEKPTFFNEAKFKQGAVFYDVDFQGYTTFEYTQFAGMTLFPYNSFLGSADFSNATFTEERVDFSGCEFHGDISWSYSHIESDIDFSRVKFHSARSLDLSTDGHVSFVEASFGAPATIDISAVGANFTQARWEWPSLLRITDAEVDLTNSVPQQAISLKGFGKASLVSLHGIDCAMLTVTDVDLSKCRFAGTVHLDQLRLEGRYPLPSVPSGAHWRGWRPVRWTARRTLAEEQYWRASRGPIADGWTPAPQGVEVLEPIALAPIYRQLRKILEDGK